MTQYAKTIVRPTGTDQWYSVEVNGVGDVFSLRVCRPSGLFFIRYRGQEIAGRMEMNEVATLCDALSHALQQLESP